MAKDITSEKKLTSSLCRRKSVSFLEVDAKSKDMLNSNSREIVSDKLRNYGGTSTESSVFETDGSKNDESQILNRISEHEDDVLSMNDKTEQTMNETIKEDGLINDTYGSTKTEVNDRNGFSNSSTLNSGIMNKQLPKPSSINIKENIVNNQNVSFSQTNIRNKSACVEDGVVIPDINSSTPSAATSLLNPTRLDSTNRMNSTNSTGNFFISKIIIFLILK